MSALSAATQEAVVSPPPVDHKRLEAVRESLKQDLLVDRALATAIRKEKEDAEVKRRRRERREMKREVAEAEAAARRYQGARGTPLSSPHNPAVLAPAPGSPGCPSDLDLDGAVDKADHLVDMGSKFAEVRIGSGDGDATTVGTCACEASQAVVQGAPEAVASCFCVLCQKRTGSAFGWQARWPRGAVKLSSQVGMRTYVRAEKSGNLVSHFCTACGSTLAWELPSQPESLVLALGCFATPNAEPVSPDAQASLKQTIIASQGLPWDLAVISKTDGHWS